MFWELIIDHNISIKSTWIHTPYKQEGNKKIRYSKNAILHSYFHIKDNQYKANILQQLPINIYSFVNNATDISVAEKALQRWFSINNDQKWQPIIHGIRRAMSTTQEIGDTTKYTSLVSEIETFLDIIGESKTDIDRLVELYASDYWKESFLKVAENKTKKETIGQWAQNIRNSITHPKTCQKKAKGKYWEVASDPFYLQKIYAHLSGLFIKAVLSYIGSINVDHIEKYTGKFIESRVSFSPIHYK